MLHGPGRTLRRELAIDKRTLRQVRADAIYFLALEDTEDLVIHRTYCTTTRGADDLVVGPCRPLSGYRFRLRRQRKAPANASPTDPRLPASGTLCFHFSVII